MSSLVSNVMPNPSFAPMSVSDNRIVKKIRRRAKHLARGLFAVGIEILPYELVGVIVDVQGTLLGAARAGLPNMDVNTVVDRIARLASDLASAALGIDLSSSRLCIGIELGGPVDAANGMVHSLRNNPHDHGEDKPPYHWTNEYLADLVQKATGCVTVIENDAQAHAAYELRLGLGQRTASFALLLIRHGVGGAVVLDNKLVQIPMEIGHLVVKPDGRRCDCEMYGCIEAYAGKRAIPAVMASHAGVPGASFEWAVNHANSGGPLMNDALTAFTLAGWAIARGVTHIVSTFGVPNIVIYGPEDLVVEASGRAASTFMTEVRTFWRQTFAHLRGCEITTEPIEPQRGAVGAALIAFARHFSISLDSSQLEYAR
jgi:predicted NBD/HSP70 family sugar kinase